MTKKYFPLIAAIGWLAVCTFLLTLPGENIPTENWLDKIWFDKWVHIGLFASLAIIWCIGWRSVANGSAAGTMRKAFILIGVLSLLYGIAMEFVQGYCIPDRSFDIADIITDAIGSAAGVIFSNRRYIKK